MGEKLSKVSVDTSTLADSMNASKCLEIELERVEMQAQQLESENKDLRGILAQANNKLEMKSSELRKTKAIASAATQKIEVLQTQGKMRMEDLRVEMLNSQKKSRFQL